MKILLKLVLLCIILTKLTSCELNSLSNSSIQKRDLIKNDESGIYSFCSILIRNNLKQLIN